MVSGTDVRRPCGQLQADAADPAKGSTYGPCRFMDFELEMAFFVGGKENGEVASRPQERATHAVAHCSPGVQLRSCMAVVSPRLAYVTVQTSSPICAGHRSLGFLISSISPT